MAIQRILKQIKADQNRLKQIKPDHLYENPIDSFQDHTQNVKVDQTGSMWIKPHKTRSHAGELNWLLKRPYIEC